MQKQTSIELIWEQYRTAIKSYLHSKVSNPDDVDDLLQDILLKTHSHLYTLKSRQSIKPWLFQIANHTIIDFYRKKAKEQPIHPEDLWYHENDVSTQQELSKCIVPFIRSLATADADLLTAIDLDGISQKEYAKKTGVRYSTLKSRVQKSRTRLRSLFTKCCHLTLDHKGRLIDCTSKSSGCNNR